MPPSLSLLRQVRARRPEAAPPRARLLRAAAVAAARVAQGAAPRRAAVLPHVPSPLFGRAATCLCPSLLALATRAYGLLPLCTRRNGLTPVPSHLPRGTPPLTSPSLHAPLGVASVSGLQPFPIGCHAEAELHVLLPLPHPLFAGAPRRARRGAADGRQPSEVVRHLFGRGERVCLGREARAAPSRLCALRARVGVAARAQRARCARALHSPLSTPAIYHATHAHAQRPRLPRPHSSP